MSRSPAGLSGSAKFVDLFAGCGGLSLGLMDAGWRGSFAIEKDPLAFKTLKANLIDGDVHQFDWPEWLPKEPIDIGEFNQKYWRRMEKMRDEVALVAAGPPCQGFSFLGKRKRNDRRNRLFRRFLKVVEKLEPDFLLLENVPGFDVEHGKKSRMEDPRPGRPTKAYSHRIRDQLLENYGYEVFGEEVRAENCGVPQRRPRYFMIGVRRDLFGEGVCPDPFALLEELRPNFLREEKGLEPDDKISVKEAISDLEADGRTREPCKGHPRHERIVYEGPTTDYQILLHNGPNGRQCLNGTSPNSLRLVNHRQKTIESFRKVQDECRSGVYLGRDVLRPRGIKKHQLVVLDPEKPAHTISTLPDDQLHYSEPRVLTVREQARLQSFPDWFEFKGKYTTGGQKRTEEAPRYTQVGNAVAPFVAELMGWVLDELDQRLQDIKDRQ